MYIYESSYVMGVDIGTQSLKVGIYNSQGNKVLIERRKLHTNHYKNGYAEQNPNDWWEALKSCMDSVRKKIETSTIKAITVCATSSTVLLTDERLTPIGNAIMWMDQRNVNEEEKINTEKNIEDTLKYSGGKVSVEWMTTKSLWFSNNYDLTNKYIVEQLDWINYKLTNELVASACNASCKWNYVKSEGGFNHAYYEKIGMENILDHWPKKVVNVGEKIGKITERSSIELGLNPDTIIFQGGIDAHIGMIGSGAVDYGNLSLITGTSFVHLIHHYDKVFQNNMWGPYDSPLLEDYWLLEGGQLSAGSIISWFLSEYYENNIDMDKVYDELNYHTSQIEIGSEGLLTLDHWQGNRTPYRDPHAKGAIIGLTLAHNKYHIYRSILESIALGTTNVIKTMQSLGVPINKIVVGGGLTQNHLLMQMISDCAYIPIYLTDDIETSVKGAAIVAAYGLGFYDTLQDASNEMTNLTLTYTPDPTNYAKYQVLYDDYIKLNEILNPFIRNINKRKKVDNNVNIT